MTSAQAEILIAQARRAAVEITRFGWRPNNFEVRRLRESTSHAPAYLILGRAWQRAGFRARTIRMLAGRAP
jgi:hypothetical protein